MELPFIYLDHNATTYTEPKIIEEILPYFSEDFGNPSSPYSLGFMAKDALESARRRVAKAINAKATEIVFTSSGTESNNLAIKGIAYSLKDKGRHIITTQIEHSSVLAPCRFLEKEGYEITYLPVDKYGMVHPLQVLEAIRPDTILISIMHANNEVGTIQPISEIGEIAQEREIVFHTDAAQSFGKIPTDVDELRVDLLSLSSHKAYGPKGAGALFVREGVIIEPILHGGPHEANLRAGTENVPAIVGFSLAASMISQNINIISEKLKDLTNRLYEGLRSELEGVHLNGHPEKRLPNTLNVSFEGVDSDSLIANADRVGIICSARSACTTKDSTSYVLTAMGVPEELRKSAARFSLGKDTREDQIDICIERISKIVRKLRNIRT
jgi:cysteine desulfurase